MVWGLKIKMIVLVFSILLLMGCGPGLIEKNEESNQTDNSIIPMVNCPDVTPKGNRTPSFDPPQSSAELPRVWLDTNYPVLRNNRNIITVGNGKNHSTCQAAIMAAQPGDEVIIDAGFVCSPIKLLNKGSSTEPIIIRSSKLDQLPPLGTRVSRADSANMAVIETDNVLPAVSTQEGAHHYRLVGLEIRTTSTLTAVNNGLVNLGSGTETTEAQYPYDIILDRTFIHGYPMVQCKRGIYMNGYNLAVVDSIIDEIHVIGQDSQAVGGNNGPGPFKIVNNELIAATENILFGGDKMRRECNIPSDIEIRKNLLTKPLSWQNTITTNSGQTGKWAVKNLFELKSGLRVLFDGNILENHWVHAQPGLAVVFTPRNNGTGATGSGQPWIKIADVTFTNNIIRNVSGGFSFLLQNDNDSAAIIGNMHLENNLMYNVGDPSLGTNGRMIQLLGDDQGAIVFKRNTFIKNQGIKTAGTIYSQASASQFKFVNNLIYDEGYGAFQGGSAPYGNSLSALGVLPELFTGNILIGQPSKNYGGYTPANYFPATIAEVGFSSPFDVSNYQSYRLQNNSPYFGKAGVDFDALSEAFLKNHH